MKLHEILCDGRAKLGISLRSAAEHLGCSIGYLSDMERGRRSKPKMVFLYAASKLYGINIDLLCIAAERVPQDIFFKIAKNPELFSIIRNYKA